MKTLASLVFTCVLSYALSAKTAHTFDLETQKMNLLVLYFLPSLIFFYLCNGTVEFFAMKEVKAEDEGKLFGSFILSLVIIFGVSHFLNVVFYSILAGVGRG